jgi:hypothetical protein
MTVAGEIVVVDLGSVRSKEELLDVLGDVLELGGPEGNVEVRRPTDGKGWGKNWDALLDSLTCLDSGGIWGTSRTLRFPLRLELTNSSTYRDADENGFSILSEVLEAVRERYAKDNLQFEYAFK